MATRSKAELRDSVLQELNALPSGQVASAEDAALAEARIQEVLEELDEDKLLTWDMDSDIPAKAFLPMVAIVAFALMGAFGQQPRQAELERGDMMGRRKLRKQAALPFGRTTVQADYF